MVNIANVLGASPLSWAMFNTRGHEYGQSCRIMAKGKYKSPHCGLDVTSQP